MLQRLLRNWVIQSLFLSVLYYLTGRLGLLLALPPGYASLVWPPFGISIAALLLLGVSRWPGVLLGAFLINIRTLETFSNLVLPFSVSVGNTLAIIVAVLLIRRFLHFPKKFYLERDIILFLVIAGPVAALVSSGLGTAWLYVNDVLSRRDYAINWTYWFIGDAIGGLIFAPLALMFSPKSRRYRFGSITKVLLPVCAAFALILTVSHLLNLSEQEKVQAEFSRKAEFTYNVLAKDFSTNFDILVTLNSFFDSSTSVTRKEFQEFAQPLYNRHSEIRALAWIPQIPNSNIWKVEFVEPPFDSIPVMPDFIQNPEHQSFLDSAFHKKGTLSSRPLNLNDLTTSDKGSYLILAMGRPQGVLLEVLRLDELIRELTAVLNDSSYRVLIDDVTRERAALVDTYADAENRPFMAELTWSTFMKVGDRTWEVTVQQDTSLRPTAAFNSTLFLLASLIFVFLICALLLTIANRIITVEEIVDEKTQHLIDLNLQLKKASETKSEFLANMSHEIRTPLNVLVGMADLLEESPLNEDQKHYVQVSKKAGHNLLSIINDILDISKIESGLVTLEMTDVDLHTLVKDTVEMFELKAQEKNLDLTVALSEDTRNIFQGDPTRIRQILSNLISNSLKFTKSGRIHVELLKNQTALPGNVIFHVSDTGIGIPQEKIPHLFQPFTQADSTITRKFGGTGLGLSISKRLVRMMKGEITLESELDRGSRFSFTLDLPLLRPLESAETVPAPPPKAPLKTEAHEPLAILIVDDTDDNRLLIKAYLKNTAHKISEAMNGQEALELAQKNRYDLILMDMQMPVMDGFTATERIRVWEKEQQLPLSAIWALTAYALNNDIDRSLSAGCNMHLVKPVRKSDLLLHIQNLSDQRQQRR